MSADWTTCRACHDLDADCAACWAHDLLARLMSVAMTTQAVIERRLASVRPVSEEARQAGRGGGGQREARTTARRHPEV